MKRRKIAIILGALLFAVVLLVLGRLYLIDQLQTRAGIKMAIVTGAIQRYFDETGEWPRSWVDLDGYSGKPVDDLAETVIVNWDMSIEEILQYDPTDQTQSPPSLVRYAHDIAGITSGQRVEEERNLNMRLAHSISHATRMRAHFGE